VRRHLRALVALIAVVAVLAVTSACGAPSYTYITNADDHVYFKVPASWKRIDQKELEAQAANGLSAEEAAALKSATWSVAYDADPHPSVAHLLGVSAKDPVALSRVLRVPDGNRDSIDDESLRNAFLPITDQARAAASADGTVIPQAKIRSDTPLKAKGVTGVHIVFQLPINDEVETFDQTAYRAVDGSRIFLFLVRCVETCYAHRYGGELDTVVHSFTVESKR
jgi:hypothetical protein